MPPEAPKISLQTQFGRTTFQLPATTLSRSRSIKNWFLPQDCIFFFLHVYTTLVVWHELLHPETPWNCNLKHCHLVYKSGFPVSMFLFVSMTTLG